MGKLNAFQIKVFMAGLMVLDHLNIIPGLVPPGAVGVIHLATRCVGGWFAYMAVEGFLHTRNRMRYNCRLFLWAIFMESGNWVLNLWYHSAGVAVYNNIFMTLAFGVLALNLLFCGRKEVAGAVMVLRAAGAVLTMLAGMFFTEGGSVLLPFILITYLAGMRPAVRDLCYGGLALLLFVMSFQWYPGDVEATVNMLLVNSNWAFPLVIPFIRLYNGERGRSGLFAKYFFYIFYPAHIWILATIAFWAAG